MVSGLGGAYGEWVSARTCEVGLGCLRGFFMGSRRMASGGFGRLRHVASLGGVGLKPGEGRWGYLVLLSLSLRSYMAVGLEFHPTSVI